MPSISDDVRAIEEALAAGPAPGWLCALDLDGDYAINRTRLRRVLDTMQAQAQTLKQIALYRAVNGDDWPAQQARAALALYEGKQ